MKILKKLKGGSLSKTEVIISEGRKFVRKSVSFNENREYGLVRWHSQIRKLQLLNKYLPESSVPILQMGVMEDYYFYDLPFYEKKLNCAEALLKGESPDVMAETISILLSQMAAIGYKPIKGSLSTYIAEEIRTPLVMALIKARDNQIQLNNSEFIVFKDAISRSINNVDELIEKYADVTIQESITHGNLTLENLLWDSELKKVLMIDPYSETYCDSIMGDVSQVFQSSEYGYEYISNLMNNNEVVIDKYPFEKIPECYDTFTKKLSEKIKKNSWYSAEYLKILKASQFIRMFPFKVIKTPRLGVAFMMLGINILDKQ